MNNAEKNKPEYVRPELVVISYAAEDVIFASGDSNISGGIDVIYPKPEENELPPDEF